VAEAMAQRRTDGTIGSAVLLLQNMNLTARAGAMQTFARQQLLRAALTAPATFEQLRWATGTR
jgi:hypothetical protein